MARSCRWASPFLRPRRRRPHAVGKEIPSGKSPRGTDANEGRVPDLHDGQATLHPPPEGLGSAWSAVVAGDARRGEKLVAPLKSFDRWIICHWRAGKRRLHLLQCRLVGRRILWKQISSTQFQARDLFPFWLSTLRSLPLLVVGPCLLAKKREVAFGPGNSTSSAIFTKH